MKRIGALALVLVFGIAWLEVHGSSVSLPCSHLSKFPTLWLNTSTQVTEIVGNRITAYARKPNGAPYLDTWQRIELMEIQELALVPSIVDPTRLKCAPGVLTPDAASHLLLRALEANSDNCNCTQTFGTRPFQSGISEQFVEMEITRNDWPDFKISVTFSLVNETFTTTVPPSPETFFQEYPLTCTPKAPKMSLQISNWNWTSPGVVNSSLRVYYSSEAQAEDDSWITVSQPNDMPITTFTTNTTNVFIESTFLNAFRADGIEYVIALTREPTRTFPLQSAPFAFNLCHDYLPPNMTYSDLFYDPSIVALFTGPTDDISSNSETSKKKSLNPAAYIVPIVVVGLLIITLIALVIFIPSVRHFFKPFSKPQDRSSAGFATQSSQSRPETGNGNNWARASTPASP